MVSGVFQKLLGKQRKMKNQFDAGIYRKLILALTIAIFITIVLGGILRSAEPGQTCPDWPTCFGNLTIPAGDSSMWILFDFFHRGFTLLSVVLNLAVCLLAFLFFRHKSWLGRATTFLFILTILQIALGGIISQNWLVLPPQSGSALHMILSLVMLTLSLYIAIGLYGKGNTKTVPPKLVFRSPFARLFLALMILTTTMVLSGLILSRVQPDFPCTIGSGAFEWVSCLQFSRYGGLFAFHKLLVGLAAITVSFLLLRGWKTQRSQVVILVTISMTFVMFWAQALLGLRMVVDQTATLLILHQVTAVGMWSASWVGFFFTGLTGRSKDEEQVEGKRFEFGRRKIVDLLLLTKPIVVALLLVTTYAGMVIGGQSWPPIDLTIWTLLAGFMAAGGSGAVNQFIDRHDDERMQRTQKRPIPAGRLSPAEGLAFGVVMLLVAFYLMVSFVNLLAALLSLAGMIYYVLIYSIMLKKTTVQNIVIGGGAGAIPPLVGWAAATGSLNVPSLFLFAVVFMWTPPHFWALALVRRKDYARAGVPMLPVIRGELETRKQILIYTVELVILTMLLPLFGLGGSIYLVGAGLLGIWLFRSAWKVWKNGGNKLAWKMYRYSSMYLAFLFVVLMVDALL